MTIPTDFLDKIQDIPGYEEISFTKKQTTFRINTLKSTVDNAIATLESKGFLSQAVSGVEGAFHLKSRSQRELTETDEYKEGLIYLQNASSQIPAIVLSPMKNDLVLDVCAAPGSKTTQMAAMMENGGQIIANDMSRVRLYKLSSNLKNLGVTNTRIMHLKAQDLWRNFTNTFDKVLVDVPCSMEGRFIEGYEKSYKDWSQKKVLRLAAYQKQILHSAISCAKPGGTIVYSTCTISPEENEGVVSWFLEKHHNLAEIVEIGLNLNNMSNGLNSYESRNYISGTEKSRRIIPDENFEAFYIAKFIKKG